MPPPFASSNAICNRNLRYLVHRLGGVKMRHHRINPKGTISRCSRTGMPDMEKHQDESNCQDEQSKLEFALLSLGVTGNILTERS